MATKLNKAVTRETLRPCFTGRTLVITLNPGDYISIKEKGRHKFYTIAINKVFQMAALSDVNTVANKVVEGCKKRKVKIKVSRGLLR